MELVTPEQTNQMIRDAVQRIRGPRVDVAGIIALLARAGYRGLVITPAQLVAMNWAADELRKKRGD